MKIYMLWHWDKDYDNTCWVYNNDFKTDAFDINVKDSTDSIICVKYPEDIDEAEPIISNLIDYLKAKSDRKELILFLHNIPDKDSLALIMPKLEEFKHIFYGGGNTGPDKLLYDIIIYKLPSEIPLDEYKAILKYAKIDYYINIYKNISYTLLSILLEIDYYKYIVESDDLSFEDKNINLSEQITELKRLHDCIPQNMNISKSLLQSIDILECNYNSIKLTNKYDVLEQSTIDISNIAKELLSISNE